VEHREERIIVETDRYRITGTLRLPRDGYRSRLTDFLNSADRAFLALTDVQLEDLYLEPGDEPPPVEHREFLALALAHIVLAMPASGSDELE
jgi:hypothetical protein